MQSPHSNALFRYPFKPAILLAVVICGILQPALAFAHSADRGFVLLLPTTYYLAGGTLAVAVSIVVIGASNKKSIERMLKWQWICRLPKGFDRTVGQTITSLCSLALLCVLVAFGFFGNSDPLQNPLPLTIWTLFWVVLTLLHAVIGNLWSWINPWFGISRLLPKSAQPPTLPAHWPTWMGYWPSILLMAGFAWFELVSLSPEDPSRLAVAVSIYWVLNLVAIYIFGYRQWLIRGEAFSVFFGFIASVAPLTLQKSATADQAECYQLTFSLPGRRLLQSRPVHWSAAVFIVLTLASVSFDGLSRTFWWLNLNGINPLAFGGRSTVTVINTAGLIVSILALLFWFMICVWIGWQSAGKTVPLSESLCRYALPLIPISLGYHFSHYLSQILVNGQYLFKAVLVSDFTVTTSFLSNHHSVERLWQIQVLAVVLGHILSVVLTHLQSVQLYSSTRLGFLSQLPLVILMIFYTWFGLWMLAAPTGL